MNWGDELQTRVEAVASLVEDQIERADLDAALGAPLMPLWKRTPSKLVAITLSLYTDALRVAQKAVDLDAVRTTAELGLIEPLVIRFARLLARVRGEGYEEFAYVDPSRIWDFLDLHRGDAGLFGGASEAWASLALLRKLAERGDAEPLERWRGLLERLVHEVAKLPGASHRQADLDALLRWLADAAVAKAEVGDPRIEAFCDPDGPEVFSSVARANEVWERDPYDVPEVHADAREVFERLLDRAGAEQAQGRILLILGEAGAGKTHLMRAFRAHTHGSQAGFTGYLQMTSRTDDYATYVLRNLIDSLQQAYDAPDLTQSSLLRLSDAVVRKLPASAADALGQLRGGEGRSSTSKALGQLVDELVDEVLRAPDMDTFDPDLLRAFLFLQTDDRSVKSRVIKYLRCEPLTDYDREKLGGMAPRTAEDEAQRMLTSLARLIHATTGGSLVLLIDQLEDMTHTDTSIVEQRFPRLIDVLRQLTDKIPSTVVVIAGLGDMFRLLRPALTRPSLDRLELDPPAIHLQSSRSRAEVHALVACRLEALFDSQGVRVRANEPLFPFVEGDLDRLAELQARQVLEWCRGYRELCIAAGGIVEAKLDADAPRPEPSADTIGLEQAWNDFHAEFERAVPEREEQLTVLLAEGIDACAAEIARPIRVERDRGHLLVELPIARGSERMRIAVVERSARGGGLAKQIAQLCDAADGARVGLVRSGEFPSNRQTQIFKTLAGIVKAGGRRAVMQDSDWRTLMAAAAFVRAHQGDPRLEAWRRAERPVSKLRPMIELLGLDSLPPARTLPAPRGPGKRAKPSVAARERGQRPVKSDRRGSAKPASDEPTEPDPRSANQRKRKRKTAATAAPALAKHIRVGRTLGLRSEPLELDPAALTRHAAFLGGTGSGKTTLALNILEQVLARGVSVLLVDRKGDLSRYASSAWWNSPARSAEDQARKDHLRATVDVVLYTPGERRGRALGVPLVPQLDEADALDRTKLARQVVSALAVMLGFRENRQSDRPLLNILIKAIELLSELPRVPTLEDLVRLIDGEDPALVNAIGRYNPKQLEKLVGSLEYLRTSRGELFDPSAERLDAGRLLGRSSGATPRTRLCIVTTKFLGDETAQEFWVARLLAELARWASCNPSPELQAVVMFDEADIYMPATSKPATKEPLQDLLKRARSAGLGIMLATQSPGDLDYRSRDNIGTWFVGRVAADTAIKKLKPLLVSMRGDASKLANQQTGEFHMLQERSVTAFSADWSLMKTAQLSEDELLSLASAQR